MQVYSFLSSQCLLWLLATYILYFNLVNSQSLENPVFWQVPFVYNTSNPLDQGNTVTSESGFAVSQDFQVVNVGDDAENEHKRILVDMSNGCSKSINFSTIQQWNDHQLTTIVIHSRPKIALIERGGCSWNKKVKVVRYLSLLYRLNIEAMMIYDNDTHGTNISFDIQSITANNSQNPMTYESQLPFDRNITSMKDNDVTRNGNDSNTILYLPVYFTTKNHALFLKKLDHFYSASDNYSSSDLHQFYQIVPILSTTRYEGTNKNDDDYGTGFHGMVSSSSGYVTYILVLVAILIIGAILLRWWKLKRDQRRISTQNEHVVPPNQILQPRMNQVDPLPVSIVNSLPIIKYSGENVKNAICCICLDDYIENKSEVRILPCCHGFCVLCIDPWLTQKSTLCPICKYDCLSSDQRLERQQQQQQQQQYDTTTSDDGDHDMDLSDIAAAYYRNNPSTSRPTRLEHNQYHDDANLSIRQNDGSQPTSEQTNIDISDRSSN